MFIVFALLGLGLEMADAAAGAEPEHARNAVYQGVLAEGLSAGGATVKLPAPRVTDGQGADAQRAALREVAGSDGKLDEMVRNSVTAPFIMKVRDEKAEGATIRVVDLWFVVHAGLEGIDPVREAARTDNKDVEAGNMAVQTRLLKPEELRAAGVAASSSKESGSEVWYAHIRGRLLDRILFEATNHAEATRSGESIVIAARTDPAFDKSGPAGNGWKPIARGEGERKDDERKAESLKPYAGGISYTKISRLAFEPGALLVEMHAAFVEPREWFDGAPILRSKFSVVAQDQVRRLRRELARRKAG